MKPPRLAELRDLPISEELLLPDERSLRFDDREDLVNDDVGRDAARYGFLDMVNRYCGCSLLNISTREICSRCLRVVVDSHHSCQTYANT